jgi:hypothetical protein
VFLTFEGTGIYLYIGGTLDNHGTFNAQIDDHALVGSNGSTKGYHYKTILVSFSLPVLFELT